MKWRALSITPYDTYADGIDGGSVRYEITDAANETTFVSMSYPFTYGAYIAIDVTVGPCSFDSIKPRVGSTCSFSA